VIEITGLTWYFLITAIIIIIVNVVFDTILIRQFIKKRTIGTALLTITFIFIGLAELLNATGLWYYVFGSQTSKISGFLQLNFSTLYGMAFLFFYFFAHRHILNDNDVLKAFVSIVLGLVIGVISTMMFTQLRSDEPQNLYYYGTVLFEGVNIKQYIPSLVAGLILFVPMLLIVLIRIIIRIYQIQKRVENPIAKAGFRFILYSTLSLVLSVATASLFTTPGIGNYPAIITIIQSFRLFFVAIAFLFGYFGWILPDWLKRVIRGKAWIVKQIAQKQQVNYPYSSAENSSSDGVIVQVSEQ
jgi:hypothetical protein